MVDTQHMKSSTFLYSLSVPERMVRSLSALSGGLLREVGELALPKPVRDAALYRATAGVGLRFLIEQVGDVRGIYPRQDPMARKFVYRYATGTSIELASIAVTFLSPVWVLAAIGDATRVGQTLVLRVGEALRAEGLMEAGARFTNTERLLDGLEKTCTHLALTVNMPPLDAASLQTEWRQFRENLAILGAVRLPTPAEREAAWNNPRAAMVAWRAVSGAVSGPFLEQYATASDELKRQGFAAYCARHSRPYVVAAVRNFLPENRTWMERLFD
jgi:hypothetical protein